MSNEMKQKAVKAVPNRWFVFCILTLSGGIAFKLSSMKDMFYVPMQQFMGLTNTQIGGALSAYGIVQTIGLIFGIYICDMFSKKYMIGGSLIGLGAIGVYLSTFPGYWGFLIAFGAMAILGEVTYWPVLLKAIRLLGDEKTQGRMLLQAHWLFSRLWVKELLHYGEDFSSYPQLPLVPEFSVSFLYPTMKNAPAKTGRSRTVPRLHSAV